MVGIDGATTLALMVAGVTADEIAELSRRCFASYVYVCQTRWKSIDGCSYALYFSPIALDGMPLMPGNGSIDLKLILDHGRVPRGTFIEPEWRKR